MKGYILNYSVQSNSGIISGDDNQRYNFSGADWMDSESPRRGMQVDFEPVGNQATNIYAAISAMPASGYISGPAQSYTKSKIVAGLLAILLGGLGIHKFYLGYTGPGIALLILTVVGFATAIIVVGFFILLAVTVVCLVEGVIYLTKQDDQFEQEYVVQRKNWF